MARRVFWTAAALAAVVAGWFLFVQMTAPPILRSTLTVPEARALVAENKGQPFLSMFHLTSLTPDVAAVLAEAEGGLNFYRLTTLSPEAAAALARHEGSLSFDGLSTVSEATAKELGRYAGPNLRLEDLKTLSAEAAAALRANPAIRFPQR